MNENVSKIQQQINFGLFCLLLLLYIFSDQISTNSFGLLVGRTHPLWLHLPIGLFAGVLILYWSVNRSTTHPLLQKLLNWTATTSLITAVAGLLLAAEPNAYQEESIQWHKHAGTANAMLCYFLSTVYRLKSTILFNIILCSTLITLFITGHLGGTITHGDEFLTPNKTLIKDESSENTYVSKIYEAAVLPILTSKCASCHNAKKSKGGLIMTDTTSFFKGGENGAAFVWGKPEESLMLQRIHLNLEEEFHMPPKERTQLNYEEVEILTAWIKETNSFSFPAKNLQKESLLLKLFSKGATNHLKKFTFLPAKPEIIKSLNTPYRDVRPEFSESPGLSVFYFLPSYYSRKRLEEILQIKNQITSLNLSGMPVTDNDLEIISKCHELIKLQLNGSKITSQGLLKLKSLSKLESLSISGTSCDKQTVALWTSLNRLKIVYVGETKISQKDIAQWKVTFPSIKFEANEVTNDKIKLSAPTLLNEKSVLKAGEPISLKHHINGTIIYFTTDGSMPDTSRSTIYKEPFSIKGSCDIRAIAVKPGWLPSDTARFSVFEKGDPPASCKLISAPSTQYQGLLESTFTNGELAPAANLRDQNWIGYRENPFIGLFRYQKATAVEKISLSYALQVPQYVFPPVSVKVLAGNDPEKLKVIGFKQIPVIGPHVKDQVSSQVVHIDLENVPYQFFRIEARNLSKIPNWHPGKGEKGWLFIDEVFFYTN